jgi:hypothetical protein
MSEFLAFFQMGIRHILNPEALDHLLFLLALGAVYRPRDWRDGLKVITAFTIGHSITLALAATGHFPIPSRWIEFLIPVTILVTSIDNLRDWLRATTPVHRARRAIFAGLFGLIHGAGFADYLKSLFLDRIAVPLLSFNLGIELGQIVVLFVAGVLFSMVDWSMGRVPVAEVDRFPLRARVVLVSVLTAMAAGQMAAARVPW